jgi:very-short-patch-repair endonuclease
MRLEGSATGQRNAKRLRHEMTPPEIALWCALRLNEEGFRFRRQHPAGNYVLDFYCAPAVLAIEVDGEAHDRGDRPARDAHRDAWLAAQGVHVIRYPAQEVMTNLEGVVRQIIAIAADRLSHSKSDRRPPPPSPSARASEIVFPGHDLGLPVASQSSRAPPGGGG